MTTVEVWRIALTGSNDAVAQLQPTLDLAETQRSQRFRSPEHRRRYVLCHGTVRAILGDYLGVRPAAVPWVSGPNGKPALVGCPYHVNLSHSADVALLAISERAVGVDVEQVREFDTESVSRHFSAADRSELSALDPPARARRFATLWTRKEALVKASGGRLGQGLPVRVPDSADGSGAVVHSPRAHRVRDLLDAQPGCCAAVAVAGHESYEIRLHDWCWHGVTEEALQ